MSLCVCACVSEYVSVSLSVFVCVALYTRTIPWCVRVVRVMYNRGRVERRVVCACVYTPMPDLLGRHA